MKDCTTCKYGYEDERLGIRMCHHPSRFSEDCINFNMHEEKESEHLADARKTSPNDLEEAAGEYSTNEADRVWGKPDPHDYTDHSGCGAAHDNYEVGLQVGFKAGARWQKEQMLKNAKDGWIDEECVIVLNDGTRIDLQPDYDKKPAFEFEYAQNVRVIVLPKED